MKTETIETEIILNGSRKINIGVRAFPELKNKLLEEADKYNITLSEYCENILLNKGSFPQEKENDKKEVEQNMEKVALLELAFTEQNKMISELNEKVKPTAMAEMQLDQVQKLKNNLLKEQDVTIEEREKLIDERKKYIQAKKFIEDLKFKFDLLFDAALNSDNIHKNILQKVFKINFDEKDIKIDGYSFHRVFLNSEYYEIQKHEPLVSIGEDL